MGHSSYAKTTKAFQRNALQYFIVQVHARIEAGVNETSIQNSINKVNALNPNYQIQYGRTGSSSYTLKVVENRK